MIATARARLVEVYGKQVNRQLLTRDDSATNGADPANYPCNGAGVFKLTAYANGKCAVDCFCYFLVRLWYDFEETGDFSSLLI